MKAIQRRLREIWAKYVRIGNGGTMIQSGNGTPESAVTGFIGDIWIRTDGGTSTTLYVKESGSGTNTGWIAK